MIDMVCNDIRRNKLISFSILFFMIVCAFLFSLTFFLFSNLLGAVDGLMQRGGTPDYVQMHSGVLEENEIKYFAEDNDNIKDYQVQLFLNVDNSQIFLNGTSLSGSSQDNGFCIQNMRFDYLLDLNDEIIQVMSGEIYVPVCYKTQYNLEVGQKVLVSGREFLIAGFLRDAQMTSMMASSKRFLVSKEDMDCLTESGEIEYLIEFRLEDAANVDELSAEYINANLPANGPAITKPLIKLISGLSDGIMIFVILFASVAMLLVSILCIRFVVLITLESDKTETGVMKAIGILPKQIQNLYLMKYVLLSVSGALIGTVIALFVERPVSMQTRLLYGIPDNNANHLIAGIMGCIVAEMLILLSIRKTLTKVKKLSAVSILSGRDEQSGELEAKRIRKKFSVVIVFVICICTMMVIVPINLMSTISSSRFVTYMGIGNSDIRVDIRQSENVIEQTDEIMDVIRSKRYVDEIVSLISYSCQVELPDGIKTRLMIECGNHLSFPVTYIDGYAAQKDDEMAVSHLYAADNNLSVGDYIRVFTGGGYTDYVICGIYSDITNGGKTGKAHSLRTNEAPTWSVLYMTLKPGSEKQDYVDELKREMLGMGIDAKVTSIQDYVTNTYGTTIQLVRIAGIVAGIAAITIISTVIFLFVRLIISIDKDEISMQKAIGIVSRNIKNHYISKYVFLAIVGIVIGLVCGIILGERITAAILDGFGAAGFRFIMNPPMVFGVIPTVFFLVNVIFILVGLREVGRIKPFECFRGRE